MVILVFGIYFLKQLYMEMGVFELDCDEEVLTMCSLLPSYKYFEVYVVVILPLNQEPASVDPHLSDIQFETQTYHDNENNTEDPVNENHVEANHVDESS